jgi:hypothetical protein
MPQKPLDFIGGGGGMLASDTGSGDVAGKFVKFKREG